MPELPEVETIRRGLEDTLLNKKIVQVEVFSEKSFIGDVAAVMERKIVGIRRRGKALLIDLSGGVSLMIHLRMTGQMIYRPMTGEGAFAGGHPSDAFFLELPDKQTRVMFILAAGEQVVGKLFFNDQRKFGFIKVLPTEEVENDKFIASLAVEPWEMKAEELYEKCQRHKNALIKAVILDQKVIAGIGNIYADEALYYAGIHPARRAGSLSLSEVKKLLKGACQVMDASIAAGGSTMATYVRADGTKGDYLEKFAEVFRREGQPCRKCGGEIVKIRVAGRGTHICPKCQKEKQ